MALDERPYQTEIIQGLRRELRKHRSVLAVAPTGSGKTALTARMMRGAELKGNRSVFLVHREELLEQSVATLAAAGIEAGVIAAGHEAHPDRCVQVAMVQSLARRQGLYKPPRLVVVDEAQHMPATSYGKALEAWPDAKIVGLSATPERLDGKGLAKWFGAMVEGPSVKWLIDHGYLCDYRAFAPATVPTSGLRVTAGDYDRAQLESLMDKPAIIGGIVDSYQQRALGKRAIGFAVSVQASKALAAAFKDVGIRAAHIDGDTPKVERRALMAAFKAGELDVLWNVDLFAEGVDCPGMEAVILARPTASMGLHRQQIGRVLRWQAGKTATILDHAGNLLRHGLPDDEIEWSLADRPKRTKAQLDSAMAVRTCRTCFAVSPMGAKVCEGCGIMFPPTPREVEEIAGELLEVERQAQRREARKAEGRAQTFEDLVALGRSRGYKNPWGWAQHRMAARERR